ncbi:MAG TPA: hypothetical protein VNM70_00355, partial [Burkholderiales bacterium]|nr:hypothetical protein [Burkholderiales bacterium]
LAGVFEGPRIAWPDNRFPDAAGSRFPGTVELISDEGLMVLRIPQSGALSIERGESAIENLERGWLFLLAKRGQPKDQQQGESCEATAHQAYFARPRRVTR